MFQKLEFLPVERAVQHGHAVVAAGRPFEVDRQQQRAVVLHPPLHAPRCDKKKLLIGLGYRQHLPVGPLLSPGIIGGVSAFVRTRLVQKLRPLAAVAESGADGDELPSAGMPTGSHVADGDRFVVLARLPSQLGDLSRASPGLAEIVGSQKVHSRIMVIGRQMLLNGHHDRRPSLLAESGQRSNSRMKPAERRRQFLEHGFRFHIERKQSRFVGTGDSATTQRCDDSDGQQREQSDRVISRSF